MKNAVDATSRADSLPSGLAKPAVRALHAAGYTDLKSLNNVSEAELLKLHGMGLKAIRTIRESLRAHKWELRD